LLCGNEHCTAACADVLHFCTAITTTLFVCSTIITSQVGEAAAFIAAAHAALAACVETEAALGRERQRKEGCDRIRSAELARLEPPTAALAALELR
jgi:hypothetical protein